MSAAVLASIPEQADVARMRHDRVARLQSVMREQSFDALVLLGTGNVSYATSASWPIGDSGRANFEQPVAVVLADDEWPHVFTPFRQDAAQWVDFPEDHLHGPVHLDYDEGVRGFAAALSGLVPHSAAVATDEWTHAMRRELALLFADGAPADAGRVVAAAKIIKTPDELACLRTSLRITEAAAADVQSHLAPGVRQTDLTARFLRRIFDEGADANILDPIWQVMPARIADGPWTTTGDLACPLLTTERELAAGDVLWVDTGIMYGGLHSDFGRTWIAGQEPTARQRAQYGKWSAINDAVLAVTRPGARAADLTRAAVELCGGTKPWMPHFYLGHGLGIESAEMPFVGSDLGEEFDANLVLAAGMILIIEPIVWDDGAAGYRSENVFLITDDGWVQLTDYPYDPF